MGSSVARKIKKSPYNCVNAPKNSNGSVKHLALSTTTKFGELLADGRYNAFELIGRILAWRPAFFSFMLPPLSWHCRDNQEDLKPIFRIVLRKHSSSLFQWYHWLLHNLKSLLYLRTTTVVILDETQNYDQLLSM